MAAFLRQLTSCALLKAAVGQQMKLLEESLQTPLFDRNGYMPTLNSVGIAFVKEAHKVLLSYDTLFNSMDEEDDFFWARLV